jgi:hypothetical protein
METKGSLPCSQEPAMDPKSTYPHLIMRSLHDVYEMNACRTNHVCLSVYMIQLENWGMGLDKIWYGCYATGNYPKIVLYNSLQLIIIPTWRTNKLVR